MKQLFILLAFAAALSGCASGVVMTEEDNANCKAQGCTVWTDAEIVLLINRIFRLGFAAEVKSGVKSI